MYHSFECVYPLKKDFLPGLFIIFQRKDLSCQRQVISSVAVKYCMFLVRAVRKIDLPIYSDLITGFRYPTDTKGHIYASKPDMANSILNTETSTRVTKGRCLLAIVIDLEKETRREAVLDEDIVSI